MTSEHVDEHTGERVTKRELETRIAQHGGVKVQNYGAHTAYIVASPARAAGGRGGGAARRGKQLPKVQAWIDSCRSGSELVRKLGGPVRMPPALC